MNIVSTTLRRISTTMACMLIAISCVGCASFTTYHNADRVPGKRANAIFIDAKQRALLTSPSNGDEGGILRFCAEPSPDIFSAISSRLGLSAVIGREKTRNDLSAELQQAFSENAATIGRTQTLNVLREMMYRNCERYLSGAITKSELIIQAARDQRAIVHVLAIEQLTGAARTQSIALATSASASSSGGGEQAMKSLQTAYDTKQSLAKAATDARKAANEHAPAGACQSGKDPYADASDDDKPKIPDKQKRCLEANEAETKAREAADHYAEQKKLADRTGTLSTEASGQVKDLKTESQQAQIALANAVKDIVKASNDFNEMGMTCVVLFRNFAEEQNALSSAKALADSTGRSVDAQIADADAFSKSCLEYLNAIVSREKAQAERLAEEDRLRAIELQQERSAVEARMLRDSLPDAQAVWNRVQKSGRVDAALLQAMNKSAKANLLPSEMKALVSASDLDAFARTFTSLRANQKSALRAVADTLPPSP